ncbi:hypothetical protein A2933_00450 [Candidatus Nomurabacteria bacterium RIFCSPLOWO2_01_FULL_46_18]|uniref:SHS2 domain-containing protein n=1 Tax=Candidatus Nomurabacteria bacterium RIFCSPLOWO2_01_FULL_46_18 TaxID=1801783 RepID=A0A1F6XE53_9BACT|nr:MAG: hypothetical protein A2933_00450 [Candidatus Nomurabacteria bacterium RIFCSPLOWO2_01_FULL_46_18]
MGIFSRGEKRKLGLVFDIGSSSVGGALFYIEKSKVPQIFHTVREPLVLLPKLDIDQFLSLTFKTLSTVAEKISQAGVGAPDKIFCVLGPAWYGSQTRIIKLAKNTPFTFTTKLADELIQKEIHLFEEEHLLRYLEEEERSIPIELKNLKISLNGYPTENPLFRRARELEMTIFISMGGKLFLEQAQAVIRDHFHRDEVKFSSLTMASFTAVRDLYSLSDFLLVNIGGEITAIALVKKDILCESNSFPMGRNFIIREVARELGVTLEEAKSLVSLYKDEHAEGRVRVKLEKAIGKIRSDWLKKFQESLAGLSNDISLPSDIFVIADPDLANFFSEMIKNEQLSQYTLTDSKFKINFLDEKALHGAVSFTGNATRDSALSLESIYINRYLC